MQKKTGISLIVLVITILVMIILAVAVIITLNNNGIIDKANEAVDKTNEKQVEELANLAWADAYAENVGKSDEELLQALKTSVKKALENNNLSDDYTPYVTTKGVEILKGTGWVQTSDRHVIKGDTVLEIGDNISYDETKGGTVTVDQDVDWQVLGAENGELLILSTSIKSMYTIWKYGESYKSAITELNELCTPYGKGENATGARSITVEDVDRVTGYDKTTYTYTSIAGDYKIKYGDSITFYWDNTSGKEEYPYYETSSGLTGNLNASHSYFQYFDGNDFVKVEKPSNLSAKQKICTQISTFYRYNAKEDTKLVEGSNAYNMLFNSSYWLASRCFAGAGCGYGSDVLPTYAVRYVSSDGSVVAVPCVTTFSQATGHYADVRAVVHLSSDYSI